MVRNPFCQAFDFQSGQILELDVEEVCLVYLMTESNVIKYCEGRYDYEAEGCTPFVIRSNSWPATRLVVLISERELCGRYRLRLGIHVTEGGLEMKRVKSAAP